ncbi:uncharacterized protein PV09_06828 [Verruconis gallopava]|uniref:Uncharacterized protein n=1 Tax=Verruconis gallopava TaxID=253628 RepID=A0A0D1YLE3_9PEZI|nr:uncharacterized protein PV09_06828 [Verruconis gallopava]KIW01642.1 hypothetical protein PV09_06828 [Verruconis gallopava]
MLLSLARFVTIAALCLFTSAAPHRLHRRYEVIDHDAVVGFAQAVPDGTIGDLYLKYKPYLYVANGCVPFPAVDADGNVSGGLNPSGGSSSGCSSSTGQVYVRGETYNGYFAIMYAWFFPKDEPSPGIGHRYDWENIVVWLSSESTDATLLGVAVSQHSGYSTSTSPHLDGSEPTIEYESIWPLDHALYFTSTVGGQQPMIAWENLTDAARSTLNTYDFGAANCKVNDNHFESELAKATL